MAEMKMELASKGDSVVAHGLTGRCDLNDLAGSVLEVHEDRGRCTSQTVRL